MTYVPPSPVRATSEKIVDVGSWNPVCRRLLGYWQGLQGSAGVPWRSDLDPCDLRGELPYLFMLDVPADILDTRYRLIGTCLVCLMGRGLTGTLVREHAASFGTGDGLLTTVEQAVYGQMPVWSVGTATFPIRPDITRVEQLLLPLCRSGPQIDLVLGCLLAIDSDGKVVRPGRFDPGVV